MSVKLRKRKNRDGTTSLLLDIYHKGERKIEFLSHLKLAAGSSPSERLKNRENLQLAEKIAIARAHELTSNDYDVSFDLGKKTMVIEWMQSYIDSYKKNDKKNMQGVFNRFKNFLKEENKGGLTFKQLDEVLVTDFKDYLIPLHKGEGANSYFARFKKMLKRANQLKLLTHNPAINVSVRGGFAKEKEVLGVDEIIQLAKTPIENQEIRRAFLFSCVTGLRWIDVKTLKWSSVRYESRYLIKSQTKTGKDIITSLNDAAMRLLGPVKDGETFIFDIPTSNGCNKTLKMWVKKAGIDKYITWHQGRHSAGTNLALNGHDIYSISTFLGHTSMKHTSRYVKEARRIQAKAADTLNISFD